MENSNVTPLKPKEKEEAVISKMYGHVKTLMQGK